MQKSEIFVSYFFMYLILICFSVSLFIIRKIFNSAYQRELCINPLPAQRNVISYEYFQKC